MPEIVTQDNGAGLCAAQYLALCPHFNICLSLPNVCAHQISLERPACQGRVPRAAARVRFQPPHYAACHCPLCPPFLPLQLSLLNEGKKPEGLKKLISAVNRNDKARHLWFSFVVDSVFCIGCGCGSLLPDLLLDLFLALQWRWCQCTFISLPQRCSLLWTHFITVDVW